MSFIHGFQIRERLYESKRSLVVRAIRDTDGLPVVIKVLKNDYPTTAELARYRHEFDITHSLDLAGVIRSYELRRHEKTLLIVLEDFGGMTVGSLLRDRPLSLDEFLDTAIQVDCRARTGAPGADHPQGHQPVEPGHQPRHR